MNSREIWETFLLGAGFEEIDTDTTIDIGYTTPLYAPREGVFLVMEKYTKQIDLLVQMLPASHPECIRLLLLRGFTYKEYEALYDFRITDNGYGGHPIFFSLMIKSEQHRKRLIYLYPEKTYANYMALLCKALQAGSGYHLVSFFLMFRVVARLSRSYLHAHTLIVGSSGAGKSRLMEFLFYGMMMKSKQSKKYSMIMIDPHGSSADRVARLAGHSTERVVYVSNAIEGHVCVINPFDNDGSDAMKRLLTAELAETLAELLGDASHNVLTINMVAHLMPAIAVTLSSASPSLHTLHRLFQDGNNDDLIQIGQQHPNPQYRNWFLYEFNKESHRLTRKAVATKLAYFLGDEQLYRMLHGTSTVSIEDCINKGKVLLVSLPKGAGRFSSIVLGKLLLAKIHALVMRRTITDAKQRPVYLFVDEMQNLITSSLASSLQELRKFNLHMILATQSLRQISSPEMRATCLINTGLKLCGQMDYTDRSLFSKEISVPQETLEKLEPLEFVAKRKGGRYAPFTVKIPILSKRMYMSNQEWQQMLSGMIQKYYRPIKNEAMPSKFNALNEGETVKRNTKDQTKNTKKQTNNHSNKKSQDDDFKDGLTPAF